MRIVSEQEVVFTKRCSFNLLLSGDDLNDINLTASGQILFLTERDKQNRMNNLNQLWQPQNAVAPFKSLNLNGVTVIRSCHSQNAAVGNLYLHSHLLFVAVDGEICLKHGEQQILLRSGESALLAKHSYLGYEKENTAHNEHYHSLLFFFADELLSQFYKSRRRHVARVRESLLIAKIPRNEKLSAFVETVNLNLNDQLTDEPELLRLKMLEILFVLSEADEQPINSFLQFPRPDHNDLTKLMETNFNRNLSLGEFARLSGRSLSTFKRDFAAAFGVAPFQWLREKRLEYARRLLVVSDKNIGEVCDEAGFENLSHFSRLFKQRFGCSPSCIKKRPQSTKV